MALLLPGSTHPVVLDQATDAIASDTREVRDFFTPNNDVNGLDLAFTFCANSCTLYLPMSKPCHPHQKHSRGLYSTIHLPTSSRTVPSANRVLLVEMRGVEPLSISAIPAPSPFALYL